MRGRRRMNERPGPRRPAWPGSSRLELDHPAYPPWLARIADPPEELWVRGDVELLAGPAVAVVGARKATGLGLRMGERIGGALALEGVVVVSGCAIGIDATAHQGALGVAGPTVAVLGGGLDVAAPSSNRGLARRIAREGCLVSEYPDGIPPRKHHFPKRNRIIAGLARITVVVEAGERSGALITARLALESGREVMAVPGHPLIAESAGANGLLVDGARPVTAPDDVFHELERLPGAAAALEAARARRSGVRLDFDEPHEPDTGTDDSLAGRLGRLLGDAPETAEALAARLAVPLPVVLATLTELELTGLARVHPGGRFSRPPVRRREGAARTGRPERRS